MLSPLLKKLLFVRQFSMADGKIDILGDRHIMLSDNAILDLQEIDETKFYETMKSSTLTQLQDFIEHAKVYEHLKNTLIVDIANLSKKLGSGEGIVNTLQQIFDLYGLGLMEIPALDNTKKQAVVRIRESTIALAYLKRSRKSSLKPVCVITAAVLAGIFSFLFKRNVDAAEVKCTAQGKGFCEFVIK